MTCSGGRSGAIGLASPKLAAVLYQYPFTV
jgi:hypothetical protein